MTSNVFDVYIDQRLDLEDEEQQSSEDDASEDEDDLAHEARALHQEELSRIQNWLGIGNAQPVHGSVSPTSTTAASQHELHAGDDAIRPGEADKSDSAASTQPRNKYHIGDCKCLQPGCPTPSKTQVSTKCLDHKIYMC